MRPGKLGLLLCLIGLAAGCGLTVQRRTVAAPVLPCTDMRSATAAELLAGYNRNAAGVQTLSLDLKVLAKTGGRKIRIESSYPEADSSHLLLEKPDNLRFYGALSAAVTSVKVFDLASNGATFQLSIPHYNEFIEGANDFVPEKVKSPWETLRPPIIVNALPTQPVKLDAANQLVPLNERADTAALYSVLVVRVDAQGMVHGTRRIFFSRCDLLPRRQIFYDAAGGIATDVTYDRFTQVAGVYLPQTITIVRPAEDYSLQFTVKPGGIRVNQPPPADAFNLAQPSGSKLVRVGPGD